MRRLLPLLALSACQTVDPLPLDPTDEARCTLVGCTHAVLLSLGPLLEDHAAALPLSLEGSVAGAAFAATLDLGSPGEPACHTSAGGTACCPVTAGAPDLECSAAPGFDVRLIRRVEAPAAHEGAVLPFSVTVRAADGAPLEAWDGTVVLSAFQPNGPGCEPVCYQGGATLE